jgi:hypothetical protein
VSKESAFVDTFLEHVEIIDMSAGKQVVQGLVQEEVLSLHGVLGSKAMTIV